MQFAIALLIQGGDRAISKNFKVNRQIRAKEVRVIDKDGNQLGIMSFRDALNLAQNQELDLVEVAPQAKPVVCRIMDYGKFRYEQDKRDKETRKKQKTITVKGVRLNSVRIGEHDFEVRRNQAYRFLEEGDKVKVSLRFRGREMAHRDLGRNMLLRMADELGELAIIESPPRMEGRTMVMILAPSKDSKDK